MSNKEAKLKAEELADKYNPLGLAPFPYERLLSDHNDLRIFFTDKLSEVTSGVTSYLKDTSQFVILVNQNKVKTRQNFTIAHELGHYFLHAEILKSEEIFVDGEESVENNTLFRLDAAEYSKIETEANNFAAALLMPEALVKTTWDKLKDIEECAKVFMVSTSAMSIRLEKLGLVD